MTIYGSRSTLLPMSRASLPILPPFPQQAVRRAVRTEQLTDTTRWMGRRIAVIPLESGAPTSDVSALIATAADRLLDDRVIGIDPSPASEFTRLTGSRRNGALDRLIGQDVRLHNRAQIEHLTTAGGSGTVAMASTLGSHPPHTAAFGRLLHSIGRRFRCYVADIPGDVAGPLTAPALAESSVVFAVTRHDEAPAWLNSNNHPLVPFIEAGRIALVHIGDRSTTERLNTRSDVGSQPVPIIGVDLPDEADHTGTIDLLSAQTGLRLARFAFSNQPRHTPKPISAPRWPDLPELELD